MISKVSKFVVIGKEKEREYKINIRFKIANIHTIFGKKKNAYKMHKTPHFVGSKKDSRNYRD